MVCVYFCLEGNVLGKYDKNQENEKPLTWQQKLLLDFHDVLYVLAGFMIVYMLFFRVVVVVGPSMYDTLVDGDRLVLMSNVLYQEPKQGDIVVASKKSFRNGECVVKRIIATEGQEVNIAGGVVYVDGVEIDEPYIDSVTLLGQYNQQEFPLVVEKGKVFVLGDNRGESLDSRSRDLGLIDERQILGKAIFLLMPGTHYDTQEADFGRIGAID